MTPDFLLLTVELLETLDTSGATIGTRTPYTDDYRNPPLPFVLVAIDGASSRDRRGTDERATVRVSVWAPALEDAYELARELYSALLAYGGGAALRQYRPNLGPVPTTDPDTGTPLASFTVEALARPT